MDGCEQIYIGREGGADSTSPFYVPNLAALRALRQRPPFVDLGGYATPGDGGGGSFRWAGGSTATVETGIVESPTTGPAGRYIRLITTGIAPEWTGVVGGVAAGDKSNEWEAAISAAASRQLPVTPLPGHTSGITRTLSLSAGLFTYGVKVQGDGTQTVYVLEESPGVARTCGVWYFDGPGAASDGINYTMLGTRPTLSSTPYARGLSQFQQVTPAWFEADNVSFTNSIVTNFATASVLRGPVVVDPSGPRGYDWSSTYSGCVIDGIDAVECDFITTGSQYKSVQWKNNTLTDGTYTYNIPTHWIYFQNAGGLDTAATGSFEVTGGSASPGVNTLATLTVNGVEIMGAAVDWVTSNDITAAAIATQINAYHSVPDYYATVLGATVTITPYDWGAGPNGYVVLPTPAGTVTVGSVSNMAGGITNPYTGYVEDFTISDINCESFNFVGAEEVIKVSNAKNGLIRVQVNDALGGVTISDAFNVIVDNPNVTNIVNGGYGVRATGTGNDNLVDGGLLSGAENAIFNGLLARDVTYQFHAKGTVIVTDVVGGSGTFNECRVEKAAIASFTDITVINKQARTAGFYTFGIGEVPIAGQMTVINPRIYNNQGVVRVPAGGNAVLQVDPRLVTNWDPTTTNCIRNDGAASALTITAMPTLYGSNAWTYPQSITTSSTAAPALAVTSSSTQPTLEITQTGSGTAFRVNDSSGDTTPFLIDGANGTVVVGAEAAVDFTVGGKFQVVSTLSANATGSLGYWGNNATGFSSVNFGRSRGTTVGSHSLLASGDLLGKVQWLGDDGTNYIPAAAISATVGGTAGTNDMPGRLSFGVTADGAAAVTERLAIEQNGVIVIPTDRALRLNNQTDGAGISVGTLTNAPAAGDPTFWLKVNIGGTDYVIPCWPG